MNFLGIGLFELLVIGGLAYFLLGPKKMGEAGRTLGKALRELRRQRDEFTAMLMHDPEKEEPSQRSSSRPAGAARGSGSGGGSSQGSGEDGAPPPPSGAK